jgi:hypothetical protein
MMGLVEVAAGERALLHLGTWMGYLFGFRHCMDTSQFLRRSHPYRDNFVLLQVYHSRAKAVVIAIIPILSLLFRSFSLFRR